LIQIIIKEENFKWHLEAFASELFIYILYTYTVYTHTTHIVCHKIYPSTVLALGCTHRNSDELQYVKPKLMKKQKQKKKPTPLKANHVTSKLNIISSLRHNVSINVSEFPVTQDYTNEQLRV